MKRILISVTDKTGLESFGKGLKKLFPKVEILASGGTAKMLEGFGLAPSPVFKATQFPECFGGRVKTLHPAILGGILQRRGIDDEEASKLNIPPIDLVICNLYRFDPTKKMEELADSMDIGGSTMIRAACKNYGSVAVVVDPNDYSDILTELSVEGKISQETRTRLAIKAMRLSAEYEAEIASAFANERSQIRLENERKLSYGENPDQEGWVYSIRGEEGIASAKVLGGKPLSYNNFEDASQAFYALQRIAGKGVFAAAVVKHGGLCGYATGENLAEAFQRAWDGDPKSAYGSIVALSQEVDESFSNELKSRFIEVVLAPAFSPKFLSWAAQAKPSLRLLQVNLGASSPFLYRGISGGMLVQSPKKELFSACDVVTKRKPLPSQEGLFRFALSAVQSVKSNAIVLVKEYAPSLYQLVGVGGGQPNRIDSLQRLALPKAIEKGENLKELVLASDGFFPFADTIQAAADAGIQYFIQPGGSMRDAEVIQEADKRGLSMIFTGQRYFSH